MLPNKKTSQKFPRKNFHRKKIEVGVACIFKDGKYLIQTRPEGKSFAGQWEFPGGKREVGESLANCVKRELLEELNLDIFVNPCFFTIKHRFERVLLILRFHFCRIKDGEPSAQEGQNNQRLSPANFSEVQWLETNQKIAKKLVSFYEKNQSQKIN